MSTTSNWAQNFHATLDDYYKAQFSIDDPAIKDWFVTNAIISGFGDYDFAKVETVYKMAVDTLSSTCLRDTVQKYYTASKRLQPGSQAPGFTLQSDKAQSISLSSFRGKVVYIDFWGVACGPGIAEIKQVI